MMDTEVTNRQLLEVLNSAGAAGKLASGPASVENAEGAERRELVDLDAPECRIRWNAAARRFEMKDQAYADHPATEVTWFGAAAWCNYRSEMDGRRPPRRGASGSEHQPQHGRRWFSSCAIRAAASGASSARK
jgi:formylglycine-generating enzyme required for sulfatase activity